MNKELAARLGPARLPFLLLPPVCVALGYATASRENHAIPLVSIILALIGAIASHISVNSFNEYFDFRSTLDAKTIRTPFSGGSGTLQKRPELAGWALWLAIGSALLTVVIGIFFALTLGPGIIPLGIGGLLVVVTYSVWAVRNPLFCLLAPGLGFGPFMVIGTHFALTGHYSWTAAVASLVPFFLVNNLLLLNQFPDVEADKSVGRKNILIAAGLRTGALVYALFIVFAYLAIASGVLFGLLPALSLIGIATVLLSIPAVMSAFKNSSNIPELIPVMGLNVVINLVTPLLLAAGILWG